jgi:hypothetical protein
LFTSLLQACCEHILLTSCEIFTCVVLITPHIFSSKMLYFGCWERSRLIFTTVTTIRKPGFTQTSYVDKFQSIIFIRVARNFSERHYPILLHSIINSRFQVTFQHAVPKFVACTYYCSKILVQWSPKTKNSFLNKFINETFTFVYNRSSNFEMNLRTSLRSSRATSKFVDNKLGNRALKSNLKSTIKENLYTEGNKLFVCSLQCNYKKMCKISCHNSKAF